MIAKPVERESAQEFFELFKIPWEFFDPGRAYDAVLCTAEPPPTDIDARLIIVSVGNQTQFESADIGRVSNRRVGAVLAFTGGVLPVYGRAVSFQHKGFTIATERDSGDAVGFVEKRGARWFARVGYDLFDEVRRLLVAGQPNEHAGIPTLDLHIAILRSLMTGCGIPVLEIPPSPEGYAFTACLTHDMDHASVRKQGLDRTLAGFLFRATVGSVVRFWRGHLPIRKVLTNWLAVSRLPLIYLGVAKDFWYEFDRYLEIEGGRPSTFFVIPFAGESGFTDEGRAPRARASGYCASDISAKLPRLVAAGCEVGLHGIDAWRDSACAARESREVSESSDSLISGVRMHWLYRDENSLRRLEEAGFSYDSTVGYNDTIGYRAGTGQAFRPPGLKDLLELPMHVMDTALFYRSYLDLSPDAARERVAAILDNAVAHGGVTTINWHDRSIAPERLWDDTYRQILSDLSERGPWFATGSSAVSWFRMRRSARFSEVLTENGALRAKISFNGSDPSLPALKLRFHPPTDSPRNVSLNTGLGPRYTEMAFRNGVEVRFRHDGTLTSTNLTIN